MPVQIRIRDIANLPNRVSIGIRCIASSLAPPKVWGEEYSIKLLISVRGSFIFALLKRFVKIDAMPDRECP